MTAPWWLVVVIEKPTEGSVVRVLGLVFVIAGNQAEAVRHGVRLIPPTPILGVSSALATAKPCPHEPPSGLTYRFLPTAELGADGLAALFLWLSFPRANRTATR